MCRLNFERSAGSPADQGRVMDGCFVNPKGGISNNTKTDLLLEHKVRNRKDAIFGLGANKSDKNMIRATAASDTDKKEQN